MDDGNDGNKNNRIDLVNDGYCGPNSVNESHKSPTKSSSVLVDSSRIQFRESFEAFIES